MHKPSYYLPCLALIALLFAGCESNGINNRINEKSAVFASLSPGEKQDIQDGIIYPGFTQDMTYIAVGKPSKTETKIADGSPVEIWSYKKFYPSGRLEAYLTDYSRARNPNLLRSLDIESGGRHASDNSPRTGDDPGRPQGPNDATGTGTGTAGTMGSLSLPDIPVYNLYIFFVDGKIADIQLESLDGTKF